MKKTMKKVTSATLSALMLASLSLPLTSSVFAADTNPTGKITIYDYTGGEDLYKEASEMNNVEAQFALGLMKDRNEEYTEAEYWLTKAAEVNHKDAQRELAHFYERRFKLSSAQYWYDRLLED